MADDYTFSTAYTVTVGDINYGGHMGNDKYLLLFHEARIRFLESLGVSERDIGEGTGLILSEAHIKYSGEVFLHDRLLVLVRITDIQGTRFSVDYSVKMEESGKVVASGYTKMAAFDYDQRRLSRIPLSFAGKIAGGNRASSSPREDSP